MRVWFNTRTGGWSGGMILVAANSAEEAHETVHNDSRFSYLYSKKSDGTYRDLYYMLSDWEEIPTLTYSGSKPCVIMEAGYSE